GVSAITRSTTAASSPSSLTWARPRSRTISAGERPEACAASSTWRPWSRLIVPPVTSPISSASRAASSLAPPTIQLAARLAADPAAGLQDLDLAPDLVLDGPVERAERVDVLQLGLDAQLLRAGRPHGDVGLCPELALLHVGLRGADRAQDRPERDGVVARLVGA